MNILDLPNETLYAIFDKLDINDVFYSLIDVNERFDRLIWNSLFISKLHLTKRSSFGKISPIDENVLDKICERVLPQINEKVIQMIIEPITMERILGSADYPQLRSLSLINFQEQVLLQYLTDDTILQRLIVDQITELNIKIEDEIPMEYTGSLEANVFAMLLSKCKCLNELTYCQWFDNENFTCINVNFSETSYVSLTLTKLVIWMNSFDQCLRLLDGRLKRLSTLIINVFKISVPSSNLDNKEKLPGLKCFSLTSYCPTYFYDSRVVPLLQRMSNLEELILSLTAVRNESTYIDGTHLYDEILRTLLPTNDDVQPSFIGRGKQQISPYVIPEQLNIMGSCRVYSTPYQFDDFFDLPSRFPGGRFDKVRRVIMRDIDPFEHQLFEIIARDFPLLRTLCIMNEKAQKNKQTSSLCITFHHLIRLDFRDSHIDYVEEFLIERNIYLPRLLILHINYETLAMVTNNFTDDATRFNGTQLEELVTKEPFVRPENFHLYFPSL